MVTVSDHAGQVSLSKLHWGWRVVAEPVSKKQPGWLALYAKHISANGPHLMSCGRHCPESCEGTLPLINSSTGNMMRFHPRCLPLQTSLLSQDPSVAQQRPAYPSWIISMMWCENEQSVKPWMWLSTVYCLFVSVLFSGDANSRSGGHKRPNGSARLNL